MDCEARVSNINDPRQISLALGNNPVKLIATSKYIFSARTPTPPTLDSVGHAGIILLVFVEAHKSTVKDPGEGV